MESKGAISSTFPEKSKNEWSDFLLVCFDFRLASKLVIPSSVKSQMNLILLLLLDRLGPQGSTEIFMQFCYCVVLGVSYS